MVVVLTHQFIIQELTIEQLLLALHFGYAKVKGTYLLHNMVYINKIIKHACSTMPCNILIHVCSSKKHALVIILFKDIQDDLQV